MNKDNQWRFDYEKRMSNGVLLLLNAPPKMKFGIDLSEWKIGAKFLGIKLLPLGVHYVSYSLFDEDYIDKIAFFIIITKDNLNHVMKYNQEHSAFLKMKEEDEKNFLIGINNLDFDSNLGDYPQEMDKNWKSLTSFITQKILDKIQPHLTKLNNDSEFIFEYSEFNEKKIYKINSHLSKDLSAANIDKSALLEAIVKENYEGEFDLLLGEMQISFISFLVGEKYDGLNQWKKIIEVITSSENLISSREKFFCNFVEALYHQLRNLPKDLFVDVIIGNNFLRRCLTNFLSYDMRENPSLKKRVEMFVKFLKEYFEFEVKSEEKRVLENYLNDCKEYYNNDLDDDLPVIVDEKEIEKFNERMNRMNLDS